MSEETLGLSGTDFARALILEIEKRKRRRVKTNLTWESLEELVRDTLDPKPEEPDYIPFTTPYLTPQEFPKLKVRYDGNGIAQEWIIVQNAQGEYPFHAGGWLTRPIEELEIVTAANVPEAPMTDWERRKQKAEVS